MQIFHATVHLTAMVINRHTNKRLRFNFQRYVQLAFRSYSTFPKANQNMDVHALRCSFHLFQVRCNRIRAGRLWVLLALPDTMHAFHCTAYAWLMRVRLVTSRSCCRI